MADATIDLAVVSVGPDLPYLIGYEAMPSERLTALVVPADGEPTLFVPALEAPRVKAGPFSVRSWGESEEPVKLIGSAFETPGRVAVGDHMWSLFLTRLQEVWPGARWSPVSDITAPLRLHKDLAEIGRLRAAASAVDQVMSRIPTDLRLGGRTEAAVARDLSELLVEEGHDEAAFTIVASGPNGASPHHHPGDRVIAEGDLVVCDIGGRVGGYFSDCTRTFAVGPVAARSAEVHAVVVEANRVAREAVAPGVTAEDLDRAARRVIESAGFGANFIHRTGHGIGLEVHEHPYIVEGNGQRIDAGMAFSIEPGVYMPNEFGVRVEDIVLCTQDGSESLNRSERTLIEVA